jgi:hypothetical protein
MELAAAGEDMKKLREIARTHIEKAAAGDMQAIKELADRLDGKPAQMLEHSGPDSEPITKVCSSFRNSRVSVGDLVVFSNCVYCAAFARYCLGVNIRRARSFYPSARGTLGGQFGRPFVRSERNDYGFNGTAFFAS